MSKLIDIAVTQIGVQEDAMHTNHGEAVKYQIAAGLPKGGGFPWCQSFVYYCGLIAFGPGANPIPKTGGVLDCYNKAKELGLNIVEKADATPDTIPSGAQFILNFGKGKGHTGFVLEMFPDGSFSTIEGNSNDDGGRDGYEVAKRDGTHRRHIGDAPLKAFIIYE